MNLINNFQLSIFNLIIVDIELIKKTIAEGTEEQLNDCISRGSLKLDDKQIKTVSFVFWLCYMAEIDLTDCLIKALSASVSMSPLDNATKDFIKTNYNIDIDKINEIYMKEKAVFNEKIAVFEALFGDIDYLKILKTIKQLRNDISHNRINELSYEGLSLSDRNTKEKLIIDYFESELNINMLKSPIWSQLSGKERIELEQKVDNFLKKNN